MTAYLDTGYWKNLLFSDSSIDQHLESFFAMYRCFLFFFLALTAIPLITDAQTGSIIGYVRDAETNEPLEGAFVASPEVPKGTYANEEGLFILEVERDKVTEVIVKYLGYKTEIFIGNPNNVKPVDVWMTPDNITLKPTVITDQVLRQVHPDPTLYIKDYGFMGDHYLMIVLDPDLRRNKLVLLDEDLKTVEEHFGLGEEPLSLYTDCMGSKHYLTKNWACQVDWLNGELIVQKSKIADFERVVVPCRARIDETYYFEDRLGKYTTGYFFVEQWVGAKIGFYVTMDSTSIRTLEDEGTIEGRMATLPQTGPSARFLKEVGVAYLEHIQCPESYTPLFQIEDGVAIFDHNRDKIIRFDNYGEVDFETELSYNKERFWSRQILVDEDKQRAFTLFDRYGRVSLAEIDLEDGSISKQWELPKQFVSRIRVKDNEIFFLYKDNIYDPTNRLYAFVMD